MSDENRALGVAILGCGTVGGSTAQILTRDKDLLSRRAGREIELKYVVDIDFETARKLGLDESLLTEDYRKVLEDKSVDVVVELVGGTTIAKDFTERAFKAGKHVVTANKALLAHHGTELWRLARENSVSMAFEASCAGGIPIIRALTDGLIANRIEAIYGIVNGTSNYILTEMTQYGQSYLDSLHDAQRKGLAEADPTLDVGGGDSAHKLAIMAGLAFGEDVDFDAIPVAGIDKLELMDVQFGQELGYVMKLLAIAQREADGVSLRVQPVFIWREHPLAWVSGPFNAVSVYGSNVGHTMYYGRGAGGSPTASAVVADIVGLATGTAQASFNQLGIWPDKAQRSKQLPPEKSKSRYYLRVIAEDHPGVLAQVADILGRHGISISSVLQHEALHGEDTPHGVPVVITTYTAQEGNMRNALAEVGDMDDIKDDPVCIGIVTEHPEWGE
ncbi:MAG: homoserine dehydrogenase [Phycisphaerae bacterium]